MIDEKNHRKVVGKRLQGRRDREGWSREQVAEMSGLTVDTIRKVEEGAKMHHCVFANEYWNVKKHPDSLILSAKDRQGNRLETVEVNMKTWSIVQSRGLLNDPSERHDEIIELVKQNMNKLKIA